MRGLRMESIPVVSMGMGRTCAHDNITLEAEGAKRTVGEQLGILTQVRPTGVPEDFPQSSQACASRITIAKG